MATTEQKNQLIAKIATSADPKKWDGKKLQSLLELPTTEFDEEIADSLNGCPTRDVTSPEFRFKKVQTRDLGSLMMTRYPTWTSGQQVVMGIERSEVIDFSKLPAQSWSYQNGQFVGHRHSSMHQILSVLVPSYKKKGDKDGKTYRAEEKDGIHKHLGFCELLWIVDNWPSVPETFRNWAKRKLLFGMADIFRKSNGYFGYPHAPCLDCGNTSSSASVYWVSLDCMWEDNCVALSDHF